MASTSGGPRLDHGARSSLNEAAQELRAPGTQELGLRSGNSNEANASHLYHPSSVRTVTPGFSAENARRIVGINYRQLDYLDKTVLLRP